MSLEAKIVTDLKAAMKAKDKVALRGIRAIKSQIILAKTDGSGKVLDEAAEIKMLQKMVKQRKDSTSANGGNGINRILTRCNCSNRCYFYERYGKNHGDCV